MSSLAFNIDDYEIIEKHDIGNFPTVNGYYFESYKAINAKSKEEVGFNIYKIDEYCSIKDKAITTLNEIKGTVNVKHIRGDLTKEELGKLHIKNNRLYTILTITDPMKYQRIEDLNSVFIISKGKKHDQINPTIRSKIIFGIASTIKKLHEQNIFNIPLFGNVCLDFNLEPRIKLPLFFYLNQNDDFPSVMYEIPNDPDLSFLIYPNEPSFESDALYFAMFVYSMFTNTRDESDFLHRYLKYNNNVNYKCSNPRPKKRNNIPENYWDLLENCWDPDINKRPSFEKIVEILKDDKFALNEYSLETNLDELHEYQNRIENN